LDGTGPAALIELKCTHTGDVSWGRWGIWSSATGRAALVKQYGTDTYLEALIRRDAEKALALAGDGDAFVAVVVTHVADPVPRNLSAIVKYRAQLANVADQSAAETAIAGYLQPLGHATKVRLGDGLAFGLRCGVDVWLCGPVAETLF
jgi:hypothetical protein